MRAVREHGPGLSRRRGRLLAPPGVAWLVQASPHLCLHPHMASSLGACLTLRPNSLLIRTPVIEGHLNNFTLT